VVIVEYQIKSATTGDRQQPVQARLPTLNILYIPYIALYPMLLDVKTVESE